MKKFLSVVIAAAMTTLGLVAVSGSPANATCTPTKYTGCFNTVTTVVAPTKVKRGRSVPISVTVVAPGNTPPTGTVTIAVSSSGGGVVYTSTNAYVGGTLTFVTQTLFKRGRYVVTATYNSPPNSSFNGSAAATTFKVKKKKRHHRR